MTTAVQLHEQPHGAVVAPAAARLTILKPVAPIGDVIQGQNELRKYIKEGLSEERDYGTIPGVDKPSLFKAGAERINAAYGVIPRYTVLESEIDHFVEVPWVKRKKRYANGSWTGDYDEERGTSIGLYRYVVRCELVHRETGIIVADSIGTCSTLESKYIDRPRDAENTAMKMAGKRAYVGATLHAYGLSDEFTQDVEDTGVGAEATPGQGPAKVSPPMCSVHNKPMKDQRASKKSPKAPDWKCTVKTDGKWCEEVKWPGQWPPKVEGAEGNAPAASDAAASPTTTDSGKPSKTASDAAAAPATTTTDGLPTADTPLDFGAMSGKKITEVSGEFLAWATEKPAVRIPQIWRAVFDTEVERRESLAFEGSKQAAGPNPTVLAPGKIEDALQPNVPATAAEKHYGMANKDDLPF